MNISNIISVSGKSGLFKMAVNRKNGLIVEDLDNGKRSFFAARTHQFTPLESIAIYTTTGEGVVQLTEVFKIMLEKYEAFPPVSTSASAMDIRGYFQEILPDFDRNKVLISDIKKLIKWFNFLNERNLLSLEEETETDEETIIEG